MKLTSVLLVGMVASCGGPVVFQGRATTVVATPAVATAVTPPRVEVRDNKIEIHEKIQFDFDTAKIKPVSFDLMNEIVSVIAKNPQIKRIRIEGYASSEGDPTHNKLLSDDRAASVMKYLTEHGIAPQRLSSVGFGIDKPIADNSTEQGREANRRVEFSIVEQDVTEKKVEIDPKTGAEKVIEEKHQDIKGPDAVGTTGPKPGKKGTL